MYDFLLKLIRDAEMATIFVFLKVFRS